MIVDVEKCLIIGVKGHIDLFFKKAQEEGLFEFLPSSGKKMQSLPKIAQDIISSLKILSKEEVRSNEPFGKEYTLEDLVARILYLKSTIEKYHEEERVLNQEIATFAHFGDFSLEEMEQLQKDSNRVFQFFFRSHTKKDKPLPSEQLIYLSSDLHSDYFIGIHEEAKYFTDFVEIKFEKEPSHLKQRLEQILYDLKLFHKELKDLTGYEEFLHENLIKELNKHHLFAATHDIERHFEGELFSVEAWIAAQDLKKAYQLVTDLGIMIEKIAIEKSDKIPTCFKNKGYKKIGEDLLQMYDIPSHEDKDPSGFVFIAFAIFFSMIVADAGYGFIYLLLTTFFFFKLKKRTAVVERMLRMFFILSSCCVIWGVMIGSYFGIHLSPENPLQKFSFLQELIVKKAEYHINQNDAVYQHYVAKIPSGVDVKDPIDFLTSIKKGEGSKISYPILEEFNNNILMEIAILTGIIHLIISLIRYAFRNFAAIGWVVFMIGGYLYFPSLMDDATTMVNTLGILSKKTAAAIGFQLVYVGVGLAWILSILQHKLKGLEEPLKSIQIFADVISYLRLYALSLAGMVMAATFNQMGHDVGYALGFFIILAGHMLNMVIGVMGGFIHGLRLNFLEWYHYSFYGGGKLFNPLRILK